MIESPPLIKALGCKDLARAKALLDAGADPNSKDYKNKTALMHAAEIGSSEVVQLLVAKGARVESRAKKNHIGEGGGERAIHYAVEGGNIEVVKILLAQNVKVEVEDNDGTTPAALSGRPLLRYAPNRPPRQTNNNPKTKTSWCPLYEAMETNPNPPFGVLLL